MKKFIFIIFVLMLLFGCSSPNILQDSSDGDSYQTNQTSDNKPTIISHLLPENPNKSIIQYDSIVSGSITGTETYIGTNTLYANCSIESGANITFKSNNLILLQDGFIAKAGANFISNITNSSTL